MKRLLLVLALLSLPCFAGRTFNGSTDALNSSASVDLSTTKVATWSFWLWQNAFDSGDELLSESSTNYNSNTGAFLIDPNSGSVFTFSVFVGSGSYSTCTFARPSIGVYHHYLLMMDMTVAGIVCKAFVDGVDQTPTITANNGNHFLGNFTIYLMSRGTSSLFNAGRLAEFAIWKADESASVATLAAGSLASSVDAGNLVQYVQVCGTASPEPDQVSGNWVLTGTPSQSAQPPSVTGDCTTGGGVGIKGAAVISGASVVK